MDADDFYFKHYIKKIIQVTQDGKIDFLRATGSNFAFSFKRKLVMEDNLLYYPHVLFKKNRRLKFKKTHTPLNYGKKYVIDKNENCLNHYK